MSHSFEVNKNSIFSFFIIIKSTRESKNFTVHNWLYTEPRTSGSSPGSHFLQFPSPLHQLSTDWAERGRNVSHITGKPDSCKYLILGMNCTSTSWLLPWYFAEIAPDNPFPSASSAGCSLKDSFCDMWTRKICQELRD